MKKATDKGNLETAERLKSNKPKYALDHIVKERYPTFVDAIRDLEDCLCLCFLYSTFPKNPKTPIEMIDLCKRLCVEFMHYVIEAKVLRKVFVSIKGYYYQAEIMGQTVTWIIPHAFSYDPPESVDLRLMSIFVEFYTTMMGFVNYRLYHNLNLKYPPTLVGFTPASSTGKDGNTGAEPNEAQTDRVYALNQSLVRTVANMEDDEAIEIDNIPVTDDPDKIEEAKKEAEELQRLQTLFKGKKFFLGREIPRESLVFMIRAFGGEVSWDKTIAPGSTYDEKDDKITHMIVDRPKAGVDTSKIGRDYVQPQWVFDSINRRELLPTHEYFVGEPLPPHLSPFISERRVGDYIPPEEKKLLGLPVDEPVKKPKLSDEQEDDDVEDDDEEDEDDSEEEEGEDSEEEEDESAEAKMKVERGKTEVVDASKEAKALEEEEFKLRQMMIKKKHKGLYRSMMKSRKKRVHESKQLERKRKQFDSEAKEKVASKTPTKKKGSKA